MNKQQIKAELRRSACEDDSPWSGVALSAHELACNWKDIDSWEYLQDLSHDDLRTFYLLVAEAL